ncbi:Hint domain-containing protein [Fangia hongkongensis]|uniref:Hint domain-containing protein n=1 Tax=Fangia hongkongensis TaxID=270495 RepID=UPI0003754F22|nr:Hint domain-containing protein [Fangia hongkongensis]MBK2123904.1 hypothetical protein [Fangia hongkongensis]
MQLRFNKVINTLQYTNKLLFDVLIAHQDKKETLQATGNHPIYLKDRGFSAVETIKNSNLYTAISARDNDLTLKAIQQTQQKARVFDLTVENTHTFFVGQLGLWVHNSSNTDPLAEPFLIPASPPPEAVPGVDVMELVRTRNRLRDKSTHVSQQSSSVVQNLVRLEASKRVTIAEKEPLLRNAFMEAQELNQSPSSIAPSEPMSAIEAFTQRYMEGTHIHGEQYLRDVYTFLSEQNRRYVNARMIASQSRA